MKKYRLKINMIAIIVIIPIMTAALVPHPAFAANPLTSAATAVAHALGFSLDNTVWQVTALLAELEMAIAGSLVAITGGLLNATLTATLQMSTIVNSTPAIGITWATVRDFSSIFIIFMLLTASIKIILGLGSDVGKLIRNIVIAGLLINFSLFFTKLAIDASNIISFSFYTAIAPTGLGQNNTSVDSSSGVTGGLVGIASEAFDDGGLSNVFMQSLDLQKAASASSLSLPGPNTYWNITLAKSGAALLMFIAAFSFLAAAAAFAVRIGIVILLMTFSPIYFIAMVFPDLEEYSKKWSGMLYSMCIFMPVYLFLMYVAMSVINDPNFFNFAQTSSSTNLTGGVIGAFISPGTVGLVLQYIIAILLINAPLVAAISIAKDGSLAMAKMMKNISKWGQGAITGGHIAAGRGAGSAASFTAQHTLGRAAQAIADNQTFKTIVKDSPFRGTYLAKGLKDIANASFGGSKGGFNKRTENYSKRYQDVAKGLELSDEQAKAQADRKFTLHLQEIKDKKAELAAEEARLASPVLSDEDKAYTAAGITRLKAEIEAREKKGSEDFLKKAKEEYKEEYAKNVEELGVPGLGWITGKARKDAAKKIIKGLTKTKKDKLFDDLKEMMPDEDKDKK